jgi:putative autotransporter adhesin-like protein
MPSTVAWRAVVGILETMMKIPSIRSALSRALRAPIVSPFAVGLALAIAAVPASADVTRESRAVAGIDRVVVRATGDLEVTQGDSEALVVEAEPRLLRQIATDVKNGTLTIDIVGREFRTREPVRFLLRVKKLSGVELAGSGNAKIAPLSAKRFELVLSGSGNVRMAAIDADALAVDLPGSADVAIDKGRVGRQEIRIGGSGQYAAPALVARDVRVEIDGSGDVSVAAERTLDVAIRGSGDVVYRGDPVVTRRIDGAGSVERKGPL